ncbi:predicted protein [Lichtheimia corymbifera JMRC:FSU:9682]|uniref:F-box domain-containing protein n=1 Tax=Lichtheimia corymbifera JMRC:FSU:9682 TaxID=1263082 RepID=A0A068RYA5_9FUNG|nr:predicted protein [Lichtheimia corymbifera JMRC:FSU:9682]
MTDLWSDFTQQPNLAIQSGTCANAITDSTRRIQQCVQDQMGHLDNRARALAISGNFEASLKDVARIRQLGPFSAVGYLCAGHVYSLQGRQKAAIDVYDQGLAAVPLSDPSHQQLVKARLMAQERDSTKIDFINKFPIDIIENIAPRILSQEMIAPSEIREYLGVSHVWQERLLMCIQELRLESVGDIDLGDDDDLLERIAPHCTTLTVERGATGFHQLLSKARFPSLHTLIADFLRSRGDDNMVSRSVAIVSSLGSTLTHLEITSSEYGVWLGEILSSCPNLVHLETYDVDTDMENAPECHPKLKRLLLWTYDDELPIHDITKRLPGLEVLAAHAFYDTKDLKIIQDNCPNLKVIGYNDHEGSYFYVPTTTTTTTRSQDHVDQQDLGVHTFYIDRHELNYFEVDLNDIMDFMRRNCHTLQHAYFYIDLGGGDNSIPTLNRAIQAADDGALFKSMTTFVNYIFDDSDMLLTRWIAQRSPGLKEIQLLRNTRFARSAVDTSALFDDLIGYCELESVIIQLHGDPTMDTGGAERFIRYHGTFDSLLHTITLPNHTRLSKDALHVLTTLPRLENLSISWPWMKEEEGDHEKCSDFIGKLDRLQHLDICSDEVVPDDVFVQLSKLNITSLNLYIPTMKLPTPTILLSLLQCPNLQNLFVSVPPHKDEPLIDEIRDMLKSKVEEVYFNKYNYWR